MTIPRPFAFFAALGALIACAPPLTSAAEIKVVPLGAAALQPWQRAEFRLENVPAAENPFDPEQIRVDAQVTTPSGKNLTIPAFWFQDFTRELRDGAEVLTPKGTGEWRLRYTPTESGAYSLGIAAQVRGQPLPSAAPTRLLVSAQVPKRQHGWVGIGEDQRWFQTSDGQPLRLIGENVCWGHARGSFDFDDWFDALAKSGQNFARLWLSPWSMNLEHTPGTLNRYNQPGAWVLDHVFKLAEERGIYLLLCFDHHGMYQIDNRNWGGTNNFWKTNPYSSTAGGPCAGPNAFFTEPAAKSLYEKRLRYLIGRYGASEYLLAWQFFNEIDNVYAPNQSLIASDVTAWHARMGQWLKTHDPYRHLVTTSLTGGSDRADLWLLPEMDFTMYHSYADPAPGRRLAALSEDYVQRYKKPVMIGEFGVNAREWSIATDPQLRGFRQAQWASALGGSVGTAMSWWWEDIHTQNAYPLYRTMRTLLEQAGWFKGSWSPLPVEDSGPLPAQLGELIENGETFAATVALASYRRYDARGEAAIADRLAAERASEYVSAYLQGTQASSQPRPLKLVAYFAQNGKLTYKVNSVAGDLDLVVRIDGSEVQRTRFLDRDGLAASNHEIDREVSVNVPAGKHSIELVNTGLEWAHLDQLRLEGIRPAQFASGFTYRPEAVGLRSREGDRAILYVYSPYTAYPAGNVRYNAPVLTGQSVVSTGWADGTYTARWFSPVTAAALGENRVQAQAGRLAVQAPDFSEDLVLIVQRIR